MIALAPLHRKRRRNRKMATETQRSQSNTPSQIPVMNSVLSVPLWLIILWVAALPLMLIGIGRPEVTRTQEARVLEVGRQMLGRPAIDWIIPKMNGDVRLQKPPLPYWMAAGAFKIGGVSEGVGRIPTAIMGWLTLAVVYCTAKWLLGRRAGFFAAGCLLGSYYFAR